MMKTFLVFLLLTSHAFACWNLKAVLSVGSNAVKIDQKINHDQTYSFPKDHFIYNVKILSSHKLPGHLITIGVVEKSGNTLKEVANAEVIVQTGHEAMLTQKNEKTNQLTKLKITLTEI